MRYRLPMSSVYFYDTYAISTKMNSLKKNVRNSFQKISDNSKNRPVVNQSLISYTSEGRIVDRFRKLDCKPIFSGAVKNWISVGNKKSNRNPTKMR